MRSTILLAAVVVLAGCSTGPVPPPASPPASATALPNRCHVEAKQLMIEALQRDGDLESLPSLPDRSLGLASCKGLTSEQLDEIALALQEELKPYIVAAAVSRAGTASPSAS